MSLTVAKPRNSAEEQKNEDVAKSTWARLQSAHGDVLNNLRMVAVRVDTGQAAVDVYLFDGATGQALWLGRTKRIATADQRIAMHERDRGCTFPGCTAPAAWSQAHHVLHWVDGGATDVSNAIPFIVVDFVLGLIVVWTYAAMRPRFGPGPKGLMAAEVRPDNGTLTGPASH